jgi:hypothetical protein
MACSSKLEILHPVRIEAVLKGLISMCDSCAHSMYTEECHSKTKFDECLLNAKITTEKTDCSQFLIDSKILDDEESSYYEEKGICWD